MRKTEARRFRFLSNTPGRSRCRTARPRWDSVSFRQPTSFREIAATVTDINDLEGQILGTSDRKMDRDLLCKILKDNPLGQCSEQTPMGIIRRAE